MVGAVQYTFGQWVPTKIKLWNISKTEMTMDYVPWELIVKFKPTKINLKTSNWKASAHSFAVNTNMKTTDSIVNNNIAVMKIQWTESVEQKIIQLQSDPNIEYVQPNFIYHIQVTDPNDTYFNNQRWLKNIGQNWGTSGADIERNRAMDIWSGNGNQNTTWTIVAVIDVGLRYTHPEFTGQLWDGTNCVSYLWTALENCTYGYDTLDGDINPQPYGTDNHGTHIAGIIGAKTNNGVGIAGINPWAKIMSIRAGTEYTGLTTADIIDAINFAKYNGAKIINASRWSIDTSCQTAWIWDQGMYESIKNFPWLFIVAAGNGTGNTWQQHLNNRYVTPADYNTNTPCRSGLDNIISVAATNNTDIKATFSDYWTNINIAAPGVGIISTIWINWYEYRNGTSMATPFVTAVASLARSMRPELSYIDIKNAIINQAESIAALSGFVAGNKRLNAFQTLQYLYQAQIGWLSGYVGTWINNPFISGAYISWTQTYFQWNPPYFTGTLSGYHVSVTYSGQSFLETWITTTGIIVSLSGDGKYAFSVWPVLSGGATGNTLAYTFYLDNTIPQIVTWVIPLDSQILGYHQLQFSRTTCNEIACRYFYKIFLSWSVIISLSWSTDSTWITLNDTINNGIYNRIIWPQDNAGNIWWYSSTGTFIFNAPDAFSFSGQTNTELSTSYQSNEIIVSGIITWSQITIVGGMYNISGWVFTWTTWLVMSGDIIKVTAVSSASYSTQTTAMITIWWRTGAFLVTTKAAPSGWGWGGWGGWWWTPPPSCLATNLVCSGGVYITKTWVNCIWWNLWNTCRNVTSWSIWAIPAPITSSKGSIVNSPFSVEMNTAYLYAYDIGITTMNTIQKANIEGNLIRAHMAKMMVNYAVNVLEQKPNTWMLCIFTDIANQSAEMGFYIKLACQLGLMGVNISNFNPDGEVIRAQFGTVLSRALYGDMYNDWVPFYLNHLNALQANNIITNTTPELKEIRGYVMLMLLRAAK